MKFKVFWILNDSTEIELNPIEIGLQLNRDNEIDHISVNKEYFDKLLNEKNLMYDEDGVSIVNFIETTADIETWEKNYDLGTVGTIMAGGYDTVWIDKFKIQQL